MAAWSKARREAQAERIRSRKNAKGQVINGNEEWRALSDVDRLNDRERVKMRLTQEDVYGSRKCDWEPK
jgi:hypothetical protein